MEKTKVHLVRSYVDILFLKNSSCCPYFSGRQLTYASENIRHLQKREKQDTKFNSEKKIGCYHIARFCWATNFTLFLIVCDSSSGQSTSNCSMNFSVSFKNDFVWLCDKARNIFIIFCTRCRRKYNERMKCFNQISSEEWNWKWRNLQRLFIIFLFIN